MTGDLELRSDDLSAVVVGGPYLTVVSLRRAGRELLVEPAMLPAGYRVHGARAGITLLHPWANRLGPEPVSVAGRSLIFDAHDDTVARDPNGLPIHGLASRGGWSLSVNSASSCHAWTNAPAVEAFPFAHRVEVTFELHAGSHLAVETTVTAADEAEVPVAFGWHPYFRLDQISAARLTLPDHERLELNPLGLPTGSHQHAAPGEMPLGVEPLDAAYTGIADGAQLALTEPGVTIDVIHETGFDSAQVFAPLDAPVVSLEPMTAPTNALGSGQGLKFAQAGRPYLARFTIRVT